MVRTRLLYILLAALPLLAQSPRRTLKLDDLARFHDVLDPQCSPDGQWVAYVASTVDVKADKSNSHIWMVSLDGKSDRQLTSSQDSETAPRWSPDGKYLSFSSSRPGKARGNQVWLLDRSGGEATQITELKGRLQSYEWSPDSARLAMVIADPDPDDAQGAETGAVPGPPKIPKPIVIDRYKYASSGESVGNRQVQSYD
jgi:Tol biopolymer transport system component